MYKSMKRIFFILLNIFKNNKEFWYSLKSDVISVILMFKNPISKGTLHILKGALELNFFSLVENLFKEQDVKDELIYDGFLPT